MCADTALDISQEISRQTRTLNALASIHGLNDMVVSMNTTRARWSDRVIPLSELRGVIASTRDALAEKIGPSFEEQFTLCHRISKLPSWEGQTQTYAQDPRYVSTTRFFRGAELFKELPAAMSRCFPDGCDVLSIGCSDGKEVLSIILALMENGGVEVPGRFTFRGIDINEPVVRQAESGWTFFTARDLFAALDAGVSLDTVSKALFSGEPRTLHPLSPVFNAEDARGLTEGELAAKEYIVGDTLALFTNKHEHAREEVLSYLVKHADFPCAMSFEAGSALDAVSSKSKDGKPFVLFARNMIYHLQSSGGVSAVFSMDEKIAPNAQLLLKDIPKGTLLVVGETDLDGKILPVLNDMGFEELPETRSGELFIKAR